MKRLIIPALGGILLLAAVVMAIITPETYWLYMLTGGISVGILLGDFLTQRASKRLS